MDTTKKITTLSLISENKAILFGKFDNKLTFDMKIKKWKEISQKLQELGVYDKDWKYLRDTTWQNWRKRTIEKRDNRRQTGSAGGKKWKLDDADNMILDIIGKNTPVLEGLDVPESSGTQQAMQILNEEPTLQDSRKNTPQNSQNIYGTNETSTHCKPIYRLKKEKLEADILLTKEKIEIAKREKYKLELELFKLEKELNIRKFSTFTESFYNQNIVEINLANLSENIDVQEYAPLSRGNSFNL